MSSSGKKKNLKRKREALLSLINSICEDAKISQPKPPNLNNNNNSNQQEDIENIVNSMNLSEINILEAFIDENPKRKIPKNSSFLLTVNPNKTQESLEMEYCVSEDISIEQFKNRFVVSVTEAFNDEGLSCIIPVPPKNIIASIPDDLVNILKGYVIDVNVEFGAWEKTTVKKGSRLHIHLSVNIKYSEHFKGYFHVNIPYLKTFIRGLFPNINWKMGPYINCRYVKDPKLSISEYIKKINREDSTTLVELTRKRIEEYQNRNK